MSDATLAYQQTYEAGGNYTRAGLVVLLDLATMRYRRPGQKRAAKNIQFQRVLALRQRIKENRE